MGFLPEEPPSITASVGAAPAKRVYRGKERSIVAGAKGCDNCALQKEWPRLATARMKISGSARADILVLGANPSIADDREGKAFALIKGDEGEITRLLLDAIPARDRDRVAYGHITRCSARMFNGAITKQNIYACSTYLEEDVERGAFKAIIGVGDGPLSYFAPTQFTHDCFGLRFPIQIGRKKLWYYPIHDPYLVYRYKGKYDDGPFAPIFRSDIRRIFRQIDDWSAPNPIKLDPKLVLSPLSFDEGIEILDAMEGAVGLDFESNQTLRPYTAGAKLITGAASDGDLTMAWPIEHPEAPGSWGGQLALHIARTRPWIAHNAAMELIWLKDYARRLGGSAAFQPFDDTMAQARLYFERAGMNGLDSVSQIVLGFNVKELLNVRAAAIMEYPLSEVLPYNGLDAQASALIHRRLRKSIKEEPYRALLATIATTTEMQYRGLTPDFDESAKLRSIWKIKIKEAEEQAERIYEVREFENATGKKFRLTAPDDVGKALVQHGRIKLPMTPAGKQYKTDDETLALAAPDNPLVKCVMLHRNATKFISTYLDPVQSAELYVDCLLHPTYTAMLTRTGRLSSADPNIQNYPKRQHKELRRQIKAALGHIFVAFDYGQLEARVIAMASRDRAFCKAIIEGFDVHSYWLDRLLKLEPNYLEHLAIQTNNVGADPKKIRKAGRDIIKQDFVFNSFFGGGIKAIAARTHVSEAKIKQLQGEFWQEYSGAAKWVKERRAEYNDFGISRTLTGRVRHEVLMGNEPLNNPIQGTGADFVLDSMNALANHSIALSDPYLHPRINIHDDLIFELPDNDDLPRYVDFIKKEMVRIRYDFQIVPLMVEARVGYNWCDLEEFMTYTGDYVR
jgi:DNA polymerase I-like protein with 3'-5' exonuclease and polymerase domains/uracil-DNA glycosylase